MALSAGLFHAPAAKGGTLRISAPLEDPLRAISLLQFASAVEFEFIEEVPFFPILSLEAARLGVSQATSEPLVAMRLRSAFIENAHLTDELRQVLAALAEQPIERL